VVNLSAISIGSDIFILKLDSHGSYQYARKYGTSATNVGNSIEIDANQNVLLVGSFNATVNFGTAANPTNLVGNTGPNSAFIVAYSPSNVLIYAKVIRSTTAGSGLVENNNIILDNNNNFYVLGYYLNTISIGTTGNPLSTITSNGITDFYLIKDNLSNATELDNNTISTFNLYPNPNFGALTIDLRENADLILLDIAGNVVYKKNLIIGENHLAMQYLAKGLYIAQLKSTKDIYFIKLN
jgi:hypothetical protein